MQMVSSPGTMTVVLSVTLTVSSLSLSSNSSQLLGIRPRATRNGRMRVFFWPSTDHGLGNNRYMGKRHSFQGSASGGRFFQVPDAMLAEERYALKTFSFQSRERYAGPFGYLNVFSAICSGRRELVDYEYDGDGLSHSPEALEEHEIQNHEAKLGSLDLTVTRDQISASSMQLANGSSTGTKISNPRSGFWITVGLFLLCVSALVVLDFTHSKDKVPAAGSFVLTSPFILSAATTAFLGYLVIPVLKHFKAAQILRIEGPTAHVIKTGTPTLGGMFFIPMGIAIAGFTTGFKSVEVKGAVIVTLAMFAVGLLDDGLAFFRNHNYGLPGRIKLLCQVLIGITLFMWSEHANSLPPNKIGHLIWLPAPIGLVDLGRWCLPLTAFCCAAMSNGVNLTDGLDGLAGGTAAIALITMSAVVLPKLPALAAFGSSMAGACLGFLVHNKYKAKVFMGDTGSLALGGCLAAMAHGAGMFFPLFIASGIFIIETLSVMGQVFYFKFTKRFMGKGQRWLRMAPFHHHLELIGFSEPMIVIMAYTLGGIFGSLAVYILRRFI